KRAQGGSKSSAPAARPDGPSDISAIVKISLLNDQHKYDDVEYEEEDGDVDETVMRKCKEWLKGVESAAAFSKYTSLVSNNMTLKVRDALHTSSLPSILDSYVSTEGSEKVSLQYCDTVMLEQKTLQGLYVFSSFPEITACVVKTVTQMKKLQARKDKEALLHSGPAADSDDMAEVKQRALLDQRHLESYHRIHRLRNRLSRHYTELLREKVQRQRLEIKLHNSVALKNRAKHLEQPFLLFFQRARKLATQKLATSSLKHDDAFLRALPKTRHYLDPHRTTTEQILELQSLLNQRGCLRGPREQEVFRYWVDQHKTAQLERQLQQIALCSKSAPELKLEDLLKEKPEPIPKRQVSTDGSQQEEQEHQTAESGGGAQVGSPRLYSKQSQEQDHTELKFPSVFLREIQVPRFSTLQPSFLETIKTNILLLKVKEPPLKSKAAETTQHKLHLMHSLSLSHMAHTRRSVGNRGLYKPAVLLLDQKGLTVRDDEGYGINDLLEYVCPHKAPSKEPRSSTASRLPPPSLRDPSEMEPPEHSKEKLSRSSDHVTRSPQPDDSEASSSEATAPELPLSMEDICPPGVSLC
ncbi:hypothetical protein NFI96_020219, partial [Prochilodus magdalenae]